MPKYFGRGLARSFRFVVMAPRFHAVSTSPHLAPASAAVAALVDEQPCAIGRGALANASQAIAGEQLCCAGEDGKKDLLQVVGGTRPFPVNPIGVLLHTQQSGKLCQGRIQLRQTLGWQRTIICDTDED